ncbi:S4 domain-containing protein [Deltaproteobacteria bacterium]|nr:S4 domain-containing protein [Deltaproteobacteria bacterium]
MITPGVPLSIDPEQRNGLIFDEMLQTAKYWVKVLREEENIDFLIGLFHSGDKSNVPSTTISAASLSAGPGIFEIFQETGLCKSKGEARRLQSQGGVYVNDERIEDPDFCLGETDLRDGEILLRAGKKSYHRLIEES